MGSSKEYAKKYNYVGLSIGGKVMDVVVTILIIWMGIKATFGGLRMEREWWDK